MFNNPSRVIDSIKNFNMSDRTKQSFDDLEECLENKE